MTAILTNRASIRTLRLDMWIWGGGWLRVLASGSRLYASIDRLSCGRIDEIIRFLRFGIIGAFVSTFYVLSVWLFSHQHQIPYVAYITLATECTLLLSFALNDRLTFQNLIDAGRPWYVRCARFHAASALAATLTIVVSTVIYHTTHCQPVVAQLGAIPIASTANFVMHRLWTYRKLHQRHAV